VSETCRVIINQVKQKLHLVGYLPIQHAELILSNVLVNIIITLSSNICNLKTQIQVPNLCPSNLAVLSFARLSASSFGGFYECFAVFWLGYWPVAG